MSVLLNVFPAADRLERDEKADGHGSAVGGAAVAEGVRGETQSPGDTLRGVVD